MEAVIDLELFSGGGTPPTDSGLDSKILTLYGHLHADRMKDAETSLLAIIAAYPDNIHLMELLPGLVAATVPKVLGVGSHYFGHADGGPLKFGGRYSPPEYTMVYLELLLNENWSGTGTLSPHSAAHRTLTVMWELLLELMPPHAQAMAQERMDSYKPLPANVIPFRKR